MYTEILVNGKLGSLTDIYLAFYRLNVLQIILEPRDSSRIPRVHFPRNYYKSLDVNIKSNNTAKLRLELYVYAAVRAAQLV